MHTPLARASNTSIFANYEVDVPLLLRPEKAEVILGDPIQEEGFNTIQFSLQMAVEKMEKYLDLMDRCPTYWAALILLPHCKVRWVHRFFADRPVKAAQIIADFEDFFMRRFADVVADPPPQAGPDLPLLGVTDNFYDLPQVLTPQAELYKYFSTDITPLRGVTPFKWWKANSQLYPRLSAMAFELLSIPPASTECERVFSQAGLTLTAQRQSTADETFAKLMCLRFWLRFLGIKSAFTVQE